MLQLLQYLRDYIEGIEKRFTEIGVNLKLISAMSQIKKKYVNALRGKLSILKD